MNELEIAQCLQSHPLTQDHFRGVFALDELTRQNSTGFYVVNTDKRSQKGAHWVLCYLPLKGAPLYFDSYGMPPLYQEFYTFMLGSNDTFSYNMQQLQDVDSSVCGHYVLYVCSCLACGESMQDIRRRFSTSNFSLNDKLIVTLFRKGFGYPIAAYKVDCTPVLSLFV